MTPIFNQSVDYWEELVMTVDALSRTFAALADPTRRAILDRLVAGDATVNEIAKPFEISLQAVSKHLKVLEAAGLVTKDRDGQHRRCHAEGTSLDPAIDWLDERRQEWEDRLDRLGDHLRQLQRSASTSSGKKES
jgi:DNA-binding transcriptional ArsR family regulator